MLSGQGKVDVPRYDNLFTYISRYTTVRKEMDNLKQLFLSTFEISVARESTNNSMFNQTLVQCSILSIVVV
jgi:hypothetical protein